MKSITRDSSGVLPLNFGDNNGGIFLSFIRKLFFNSLYGKFYDIFLRFKDIKVRNINNYCPQMGEC